MKIFGTVDTFIEGSTSRDLRLGRIVANAQFLGALLEHSSFDSFHLFCPSVSHMRVLERTLAEDLGEVVRKRRIMLSTHLLLHQHLVEVPYAAFHVGGWGLYLPRLAYLRARTRAAGGAGFPLTGITHSLNNADLFLKMREMVRAPFAAGDAVVCTSVAGQQVMEKHWAAAADAEGLSPAPAGLRFARIPLGVDEGVFQVPARKQGRQALGLPSRGPIALYLGRLSAHTKADLNPLLYAFARARRRQGVPDDALLVLAGGADAANQQALETTVSELSLQARVRFLPNVSDQQKGHLLAAADLFVSPIDNYQETFGLAVVEAMAAGLPTIVSDFDGYRELCADDVTGFAIPTCSARLPSQVNDLFGVLDPNMASFLTAQTVALDVGVLTDRLARLLADPELRQRQGEAARARARQYAWPQVIAAYEQLWAELAEEARRAPAAPVTPGDPQTGDRDAIFSHYPTAQLQPGDRLRLSELGAEVLSGSLPMPALYEDLTPLVVEELPPLLVRLMQASASLSVAECLSAAEQQLGVPPAYTEFQLIWLMKQGLCERLPTT